MAQNPAYRFETLQLHAGQEQPDPATGARAVPIYQTTSYVFPDAAHAAARFALEEPGNIYGRLTNPTQEVLERRMAALEGGSAALAVASGAAAVTYAIQALAQAGEHIVAQKTIYGGSYNLLANTLPHFGITATFVDAHDLSQVEGESAQTPRQFTWKRWAIPTATSRTLTPSPPSPTGTVCPWSWITPSAPPSSSGPSSTGPMLWSTRPPSSSEATAPPWAASSWIPGHSTGRPRGSTPPSPSPIPATTASPLLEAAGPPPSTYVRAILLRDTGAAISPFNAFLLLQGIETLSLRLDRHVENTRKVVEYLASHPQGGACEPPSLPDHPDHGLYRRYFPGAALPSSP